MLVLSGPVRLRFSVHWRAPVAGKARNPRCWFWWALHALCALSWFSSGLVRSRRTTRAQQAPRPADRRVMRTAPHTDEEGAWSAYGSERSLENRNRLVEFHASVARRAALRCLPYARSVGAAMTDIEELEGIAFEGLIEAIERFDPTRGVDFAHYANLRVDGHVKDALRADDYLSRRSRQQVKAWMGEDFEAMSDEKKRTAARLASQRPIHLADLPAGDEVEGLTEVAGIEDEILSPSVVTDALESLNPAERTVIEFRYLLGMSLSAIGVVLSVTESRACQIHLAALSRLRAIGRP